MLARDRPTSVISSRALRLVPSMVAATLLALVMAGCSADGRPSGGDGDRKGQPENSGTVSSAAPEQVGICSVATPELLRLWYGYPVELLGSTDDTCRFTGLPMGELTISDADGPAVRADDGFSDPLLAQYLSDRVRASDESVVAAIESRITLIGELGFERPTRCGYVLTVGSGAVSVSAVPSEERLGGGWPTDGWVRVTFGGGLPGDECSDVADENTPATIDAQWPVTFDELSFSLNPTSGYCGEATAVILGARALAPDGRLVPLPAYLAARNLGFGLFPPMECYLSEPIAPFSDSDLAAILAVVIPAAVATGPDGLGRVLPAGRYVVADTLGQPTEWGGVRFDDDTLELSDDTRTAVAAAVAPGTVEFAPVDLSSGMLLISTPAIVGDTVEVTYEQHCGDPDALCGSGGTFVLVRDVDGWRVAGQLSAWIS